MVSTGWVCLLWRATRFRAGLLAEYATRRLANGLGAYGMPFDSHRLLDATNKGVNVTSVRS
jgi:hypothetical protein